MAKIIGYDSTTGEPIYEKREPIGYDPISGEAIYAEGENEKAPGEKKKSKIPAIITGVLIAALLVGGGIFYGIYSGAFLPPREKVLIAAGKTLLEERYFFKDLSEGMSILTDEEFSADISADVVGEVINGSIAKDEDAMSFSGRYLSSLGLLPEIKADMVLEEEILKAKVPLLSDTDIFAYYYRQKLDGAIGKYFGEQAEIAGAALADFYDCAFKKLYYEDLEAFYNDIIKNVLLPSYEKISVEKKDSAEFEIGGRKKKAQGYTIKIDAEDVEFFNDRLKKTNFWKSITERGLNIYNAMQLATNKNREVSKEEFEKLIDDYLRKISGKAYDVEYDVYIEGGKLAAVIFNIDGRTCNILFKGENKRTDETEVIYDGDSIMTIGVTTDNNAEVFCYTDRLNSTASLTYEYKAGDYDLNINGEVINGKMISDDESFSLAVKLEGALDADLNLKKDATVAELTGTEVNISELSEMDFLKYIYAFN